MHIVHVVHINVKNSDRCCRPIFEIIDLQASAILMKLGLKKILAALQDLGCRQNALFQTTRLCLQMLYFRGMSASSPVLPNSAG